MYRLVVDDAGYYYYQRLIYGYFGISKCITMIQVLLLNNYLAFIA